MNPPPANHSQWAQILQRQKIANAQRWLEILTQSDNRSNLIQKEYDNLLRALETALETTDNFPLAYRFLTLLSPVVLGFADWDRWLLYLQNALLLSREAAATVEEAHILSMIGAVYLQQGELEQAETHFYDSAQTYQRIGDEQNFGKVLGKLSNVYTVQGDYARSEALCQEALALAQTAGNEEAIGLAYLDLSHIYLKAQEWPAGLDAARNARAIFQKLKERPSSTVALLNITNLQGQAGNWEEVARISVELEAELIASANISKLIQLKNNLGVAAFSQGHLLQAEKLWQEALQLNSQVQNRMELASLSNNLGMVYIRLAEWEAAREMLEQAVHIYEEFGDLYHWANALDNLAELYYAQGETAVSQTLLHSAIAAIQSLESTPQRQELLTTMRHHLATWDE